MSEVRFSEQQRVFRLYTEALAGRPLGLLPSDEAPTDLQLAGHDLPSWDGETVYLPRSVDELDSQRANFSVYKISILHQLGYDQLGTVRLNWDECERRLGPLGNQLQATETHAADERTSDLFRFYDSFQDPALARRLFNILEDARIDAHLLRSYPGIRRRLEQVMAHSAAGRPRLADLKTKGALMEGLLQFSLGAGTLDAPSALDVPLEELRQCCLEVEAETADVYTTAQSTVRAYSVVEAGASGRRGVAWRASAENPEAGEIHATVAPSIDSSDEEAPAPVSFRGLFQPEALVGKLVLEELQEELGRLERDLGLTRAGVSAELGDVEAEITAVEDGEGLSGGLPATDLEVEPGTPGDRERARARLDRLREQLGDPQGVATKKRSEVFLYDEWDHLQAAYRRDWVTLHEQALEPADPRKLVEALDSENDLRRNVRRLFGQLKPELLKKIRHLDDGEEIDLDAAVEARVDRRTRNELPDAVYSRRQRKERDVAAAFLLDMSASTDSEIPEPLPSEQEADERDPKKKVDYTGILGDEDDWTYFARPPLDRRKVIDVEKEAVLLMAEALDALGDAYGIYGFSGFGREQVDFLVAKEPNEPFDESVQGRIAAMKPQRSTRMGPAIRHAVSKLQRQEQRLKVLLILSDGYPQDFDYGDDRSSRVYGIQDTMMALREAQQRGIHTFCITVDPAGHDYLREMCPDHRYLVINDIAELPSELPKVYRGLTT